jgi:hypothetical protein
LTKAATATGNKQQKQQNEADKPQHLQLAKASIAIGPNRKIEIECRQGVRGHRIIQISRFIIRKKNVANTIHKMALATRPRGNLIINYMFSHYSQVYME